MCRVIAVPGCENLSDTSHVIMPAFAQGTHAARNGDDQHTCWIQGKFPAQMPVDQRGYEGMDPSVSATFTRAHQPSERSAEKSEPQDRNGVLAVRTGGSFVEQETEARRTAGQTGGNGDLQRESIGTFFAESILQR